MKRRLLAEILVLLCVLPIVGVAGGPPTVCLEIATCSPVNRNDYARIDAILREHGINAMAWSSGLIYINVPENQADRARALIEEAIQTEHLRVTVNRERRVGMLLHH